MPNDPFPVPLNPLSPREARARRVIEVLLSRPMLLVFGLTGIWDSFERLPDAAANWHIHLVVFHSLSGIVGLLCLVRVAISLLQLAVEAIARWLKQAWDFVDRIFPKSVL